MSRLHAELVARLDQEFWRGRRVLLTGHTGFKGSWLSLMLERAGAQVSGIALAPDTRPSLFEILSPWPALRSALCDIRDRPRLGQLMAEAAPQVVIHMAAQPLVRESYRDPVRTAEVNVIGTVNVLEAARSLDEVAVVLVVTSDKVYENAGDTVFGEGARLGGSDPYSASKAAAEIMTAAYTRSFFDSRRVKVVSARGGNMIGGGDWAADRLVPDLWRAHDTGRPVLLRYPRAMRPWQHVLEPLYGYLLYIERAAAAASVPPSLNFGPPPTARHEVLRVAELVAAGLGADGLWTLGTETPPLREASFLAIDPSLAQTALNWKTRLDIERSVQWTSDWYRAFRGGEDMRAWSQRQIEAYFELVS